MVGLRRVDNGAGLGATTLVVLHDGAFAGAGVGVLAGRAVGHAVVELEVAVELRADVQLGHGERVNIMAALAAERGARLRLVVADTGNVVGAGAAVDTGATAVAAVAREALPGEVIVVGEATVAEVTEAEAGALVRSALVLAVRGVKGPGERVLATLVCIACAREIYWEQTHGGRGHAGGQREESSCLHVVGSLKIWRKLTDSD